MAALGLRRSSALSCYLLPLSCYLPPRRCESHAASQRMPSSGQTMCSASGFKTDLRFGQSHSRSKRNLHLVELGNTRRQFARPRNMKQPQISRQRSRQVHCGVENPVHGFALLRCQHKLAFAETEQIDGLPRELRERDNTRRYNPSNRKMNVSAPIAQRPNVAN